MPDQGRLLSPQRHAELRVVRDPAPSNERRMTDTTKNPWRCRVEIDLPQTFDLNDVSSAATFALIDRINKAFDVALDFVADDTGTDGAIFDIAWWRPTESEARLVERCARVICDEMGWKARYKVSRPFT